MATKQTLLLIILVAIGLASFKPKQIEIRDDFKKYFEQYKVAGSFVMYDPQKNEYQLYNQSQFKQTFSPASTFKICNSLIGLETGVIKDENFVIEWDGVVRERSNWNSSQDLKTAIKNSTVWYYQELARRVGGKQMKYWLDKSKYGNADTTGGIDLFWLTGGLRISPEQQIDFLKRLHDNQLPFSQRSMDIVKKIMVKKDTLDYVIRGKTGFSSDETNFTGWYVGYIESRGKVYYFANCIQTNDTSNKDFAKARIDITYKILEELKLIKN